MPTLCCQFIYFAKSYFLVFSVPEEFAHPLTCSALEPLHLIPRQQPPRWQPHSMHHFNGENASLFFRLQLLRDTVQLFDRINAVKPDRRFLACGEHEEKVCS